MRASNDYNVRTIFIRKIEDDGWHLPKERIEARDILVKKSVRSIRQKMLYERRCHKGKWLTRKEAYAFCRLAEPFLQRNGEQDTGMVQLLKEQLMEEFGVTELEAFNILRGYHIGDYVDRYERIRTCSLVEKQAEKQKDECEITIDKNEYEQLCLFS